MKFYPADWRSDPGLRKCSFAARGLWADMLCLMHEANPRGYLFVGNSAPTTKQLASILGSTLKEVNRLLGELSEAGVYSTQMEIIYSRRMVRDEEKRAIARNNGSRGGNPALILDNQHLKPKNLESRVQKLDKKKEPPSGGIVADAPKPTAKVTRPRPTPRIPLPDDFQLTGPRIQAAADRGLDAEATFKKFRWSMTHKAETSANWDIRWVMYVETYVENDARDQRRERERANAGSYGD